MGARVDKWIWSVRLYKTRSLATDACKSGKITMNGISIKASKELKVGDVVEVYKDLLHLKVKVLQLSERRMGAALVPNFMEDLTPAEEYEKVKRIKEDSFEFRDRGTGRPTKRNRRDLTNFKDI